MPARPRLPRRRERASTTVDRCDDREWPSAHSTSAADPITRGLHDRRRNGRRFARFVARQAPPVVAAAAVGDHVFGTSLTIRSSRRTPNVGFSSELQRAGIPPHDRSSPPSAKPCRPGQTVPLPAGSSFGRCSTESFDLNAGQLGPRAARRGAMRPADTAPDSAERTSRPPTARRRAPGRRADRARGSPRRRRGARLPPGRAPPRRLRAGAARAAPSRRSSSRRAARDAIEIAAGVACGSCWHVRSARITTGNSSPFALCTVISRTPSLPSSRIGASAPSARRRGPQLVDEAAERNAAAGLVLARELGDVQHVGERLLAGRPQDEADMRARLGEQPADRVGDRPVVAPAVQLLQQPQRVGDRRQMRGRLAGQRELLAGVAAELPRNPERMKRRRTGAGTRAAARRRSRTASPSASRTPTARRRATRSPRARRGWSRLPRARETPCRRRADAARRAPRCAST